MGRLTPFAPATLCKSHPAKLKSCDETEDKSMYTAATSYRLWLSEDEFAKVA